MKNIKKRLVALLLASSMVASDFAAMSMTFAEGLSGTDNSVAAQNEVDDTIVLAEEGEGETTEPVTGTTEDGFAYSIQNNEATITKYSGTATDVVIPETILGSPVVEIGKNAFNNNKTIKSVDIPNTVKTIGDYVFMNNSYLASVNMTNSVVSIGKSAFASCAFQSIKLSENLVDIGDSAFSSCTKLQSIEIPNGISSIGGSTFYNCKSLKSVKLPQNLTGFTGNGVFQNCSSLESIELPDSMTSIGACTFSDCTNLKYVKLPKNLTEIENFVFARCKSLTSIEIPESVSSIGVQVFLDCPISYIKIPDSVKTIEYGAFTQMESLATIDIGAGLETLTSIGLTNCNNLKAINVSENNANYSSVDGVVFDKGKTKLLALPKQCTVINIPDTLETISAVSINRNSNVCAINASENSNNYSSVDGILYNKDKTTIVLCPIKYPKSEVKILDSVTTIADRAFYNCSDLTSIDMPKGVTTIADRAFYNCDNLTNIDIPEGVTTIGNMVFYSCDNLESVIVPKSVTTIGTNILSGSQVITIYGYKNTAIETYFNENFANSANRIFVDLDKTVSFNPNNGDKTTIVSIAEDGTLDYIPEAPTKEGYVFVGWYKDVDDITTAYENGAKYTEHADYVAKYAHVQMLGAQGKLSVNGKSGIRFGTKIYNDGDKIVEKGTLILPVNLLSEGEALTLDNKLAARSVGKVNYEVNEEENYLTYLGTLVGIPEARYGTEITAASYVIYEDKAGNQYTVYSPYEKGYTSVYELLGNETHWDNQW